MVRRRAGIDLRRDPSPRSLYFRLRDSRGEAREIERENEKPKDTRETETQGSERLAGPSLPQLWRTVRELATEALGKSKDLEVAAWLTESLLREHDLPGLSAGAKLMTGLVEGFWEQLYPLPDDEGIATRVAPIAGLNGLSGNGTLIQPLRRLSLFDRPDRAALELWQYEQSEQVAQTPDEAARQRRIADGAIPFEALKKEAAAAGGAHFAKLREAAVAAGEAWQGLGEALDARAGARRSADERRARSARQDYGHRRTLRGRRGPAPRRRRAGERGQFGRGARGGRASASIARSHRDA